MPTHRWLSGPITAAGLAASLALTLAAGAAHAGDVAKFESELRSAYAGYRKALFASNSGTAADTVAAVDHFSAQWAALMVEWRSARPPQYADDPKWPETLAQVAAALDTAKKQAADGQLAAAHDTLEQVRAAFSALHARNGIIGFSDRMNAYHDQMEKMLALDPALYDKKVAPEVVALAGVLDYLAADIEAHPAPEAATAPDYASALLAFRASVTAVLAAAEAGDPAAVKAAVAGLKPAYARFFRQFG